MLTVFLLAAVIQLLAWVYFWQYSFPAVPQKLLAGTGPYPPVSVIVCFRNEAEVIQNCLVTILRQEYPGEFELIAVDDNSTDESAAIVRNLIAEAPAGKLRLLRPGPTRPGKKDALTYGIEHAGYDHLLLTDADCLPCSTGWLMQMTRPLRSDAAVVLGVGQYAYNGWGLVDRFQRFEAFYVAIKYLGFARAGLPYMGVGRNLAYRKAFFLRAGGFAAHADLPGGDDDLLVGNNARAISTACVTHPAARTTSRLSGSWPVFLRQRQRHQSVGFRYRPVHQVLLGGLALSHGLFFLLGFCLLFSAWWKLALVAYALRFVFVFGAFRRAGLRGANAGAKKDFQERLISPWEVAFFDAGLGPFYLYLAVAGILPAKRW